MLKTSRFSFVGHSSFSSFFVISVILRNLMSNSGASLQNNWKTSVDLVDYRLCLWQKNNLNSSDDSHITCTTHKELHSFGPESNNLILFSRVLQKHSLYAVLYNSLIWLLYSILCYCQRSISKEQHDHEINRNPSIQAARHRFVTFLDIHKTEILLR